MHNEFVNFAGEKMSKSKGNVLTLDDVLEAGLEPLAYRLLLLQSHYRSQVRVTIDDIAAADSFLARLVRSMDGRLDELGAPLPISYLDLAGRPHIDTLDAALADDLATPRAVAALGQAVSGDLPPDELNGVLATARDLLGLDLRRLAHRRRAAAVEQLPRMDEERRRRIEALLDERDQARARRDFETADALRERLRSEFDVEVVDAPMSSRWSMASSAREVSHGEE